VERIGGYDDGSVDEAAENGLDAQTLGTSNVLNLGTARPVFARSIRVSGGIVHPQNAPSATRTGNLAYLRYECKRRVSR
jgi:hypothetical protein